MGEVMFEHKPHKPSILNQIRFYRIYDKRCGGYVHLNGKAYQRFSIHRVSKQRQMGIHNYSFRRWVTGRYKYE